MFRFLTTWLVALSLRLFAVLLWVAAVAAFLASMGVLLALDYDVDVGGGVPWSNYGIRTLIGIGLFIATWPFGISGGVLMNLAAEVLSSQRDVTAGSQSPFRLLSPHLDADQPDNPRTP